MTASRNYYEEHSNWLQDILLPRIVYYSQIFQQSESLIEYRTTILERMAMLTSEEAELGELLLKRVEEFDVRFLKDW